MALITTKEAADRLGVSRGYILRLIRENRLQATRPGHEWLIEEADLERIERRQAGYCPNRIRRPPEAAGLLTTREAAERLGVSVQRVRDLIRSKRLPARKIGYYQMIDPKDLEGLVLHDSKGGRPRKEDVT
jgi:excisionase family DNA binding protein